MGWNRARDHKRQGRPEPPAEPEQRKPEQHEGFGEGARHRKRLSVVEHLEARIMRRQHGNEDEDHPSRAAFGDRCGKRRRRPEPQHERGERRELRRQRRAERRHHEDHQRGEDRKARLPVLGEHHIVADAVRMERRERVADIEARVVQDALVRTGQQEQRQQTCGRQGPIGNAEPGRAPRNRPACGPGGARRHDWRDQSHDLVENSRLRRAT